MSLRWAWLALLVLPSFAIGSGAQAPAEWRLEDPTGDVERYAVVVSPPDVEASPLNRHIDITAVTISDEDENGFAITAHLSRLKVGEQQAVSLSYVSFDVNFQIAGSPVRYSAYTYVSGSIQVDTETIFVADDSYLYGYISAYNEEYIGAEINATLAENQLRLWIPKPFLLGVGGDSDKPVDLPQTLGPGDSLTDLQVWVYGSEGIFFGASDQAPGDDEKAPAYLFQKPTANGIVSLELPDSYAGLAVQSGYNQSLPFVVTNRAEGKRILQMTYEIEGPADKAARYRVTGPPTLTIPAGATRNFTFAVDVKEGAASTDGVSVVIRAQSLAHPGESGFAEAMLMPGLALGPGSNAIHFLGTDNGFYGEPEDQVLCLRATIVNCHRGILSADPNDPLGVPEQPIEGYPGLGNELRQTFYLYMPRGTAAPIAFDTAGQAELELSLKAPAPADGVTIIADFVYSDEDFGGPVFHGRTTASVGTSPTTVKVNFPVEVQDTPTLARGTRFSLRLEIIYPEGPAAAALAAGGIQILPKDSHIRLPLVELPESLKTQATPNPFQLSPVGGREEFVNPGEARLFNVSVLHQGTERARVRLAAETSQAWGVEVLPGQEYDLMPGDTVTIGVLARAPSGSKEGDRADIRLNATDPAGNPVGLLLTAIVTSGIDLPDDAARFKADEDAKAKLVSDPSGKSPGVGAMLLVAVLVGLALRRRKA